MKLFFTFLLTIIAVMSPLWASFPKGRLLENPDLKEIVEDHAHPDGTAKLLDGHELDRPNLTRLVQDYAPDEGLVCNLETDELLKIRRDVLGIIVGKLAIQRPFLSTCSYLRSIDHTKDLVLTLPHDFTRSLFWREIVQGKRPFRWGACVKEIHLFQLNEPDKAIDAEGFIQKESSFTDVFFKQLFQHFPNVEKCFVGNNAVFKTHLEQHYKDKFARFECELLIHDLCKRHYLNIRRVKLLIELYSEPERTHYQGIGWGGLALTGRTTIGSFCKSFQPLLNIPMDGSLPVMLDLYQEIRQSELYRKATSNAGEVKKPDNGVRLFLRALVLRPDLWEFTLFINKEIAPINHVFFYYTKRPWDEISNQELQETILREFTTICDSLDRFQKCLCKDTLTILEYIATHIKGLFTLHNPNVYSAPEILFTYLDALELILKDEQLKQQPGRLFRRLFVLHTPKVYSTKCIFIQGIAVDEKTYEVIKGENIKSMIQSIHRHLSIISDQEFDEFASFLRDKSTIRTWTLIDGFELDRMAKRFKTERKLLNKE